MLLLHGSGPGVSAWANWRLTIQSLKDDFRLLAPDLAGFGYTRVPEGIVYSRQTSGSTQLVAFLDAKGIQARHVIGNSFGGSMALALAIHHPERVNRLILMGSVGVPFELTAGSGRGVGLRAVARTACARSCASSPTTSSWSATTWCACATRRARRPGVHEALRAHVPGAAPALGRGDGAWRGRRARHRRTPPCWSTAATTR